MMIHPRFDGFEKHFSEQIEPWLLKQEERRKRHLRWAAITVAVTLLIAAGFQALYWGLIDNDFFVAIVVFLVPCFFGGAITWFIVWIFRFSVKQYLVPKVCGFLGLKYEAIPRSFPSELFDDAGFLPEHDRKTWEDRIEGAHDGVQFDLIETKLRKRQSSDNSKDSWRTRWRGIFLILEFPKPFSGRTYVTRERSAIGKLFRDGPGDKVALEDPRFEKLFEVYSNDQVEARYLLTPTFMERLVALADLIGRDPPELVFRDRQLGLALRTRNDRFEAGSILTPMDNRKRIDDLVAELSLIFHIIDTLQLNLKTRS